MADHIENQPFALFWSRPEEWREALGVLEYLLDRYDRQLEPVRLAARTARDNLAELFPYFDDFSARICPTCSRICCLEARVAYDFRDLLFIQALGLEPPPHQLRRSDEEPCRYLGQQGCRLPRLLRPFICTWYYCAPMLELYNQLPPQTQRRLSQCLTTAQTFRKQMEDEFIRLLMPT